MVTEQILKNLLNEIEENRNNQENEIYNSMWMKVYSMDDPVKKELYEKTVLAARDVKKIIFSPSEREFIDYRFEQRDGYLPEEVRFFGQKEDKIIDSRVVNCVKEANCYFDRAYFLDNDVFVISEFSRDINKKDSAVAACSVTEMCTYTIKIHIVDMIHNKRLVYESKPFDAILSDLIFTLYEEKL